MEQGANGLVCNVGGRDEFRGGWPDAQSFVFIVPIPVGALHSTSMHYEPGWVELLGSEVQGPGERRWTGGCTTRLCNFIISTRVESFPLTSAFFCSSFSGRHAYQVTHARYCVVGQSTRKNFVASEVSLFDLCCVSSLFFRIFLYAFLFSIGKLVKFLIFQIKSDSKESQRQGVAVHPADI